MQELIAAHPLGVLVTLGSNGLCANHIPFLYEARDGTAGALIGHVARNNDLWHDTNPAVEAMVIFQGPSAYISPNWYATKQATHEVVPTYNYAVVHVHGKLIVHEDAKWLRGVIGKLTKRMEARQAAPWKMADAPAAFVDEQVQNIVGIELPISRMVGKWKMSQNRILVDREGAVAGLRQSGTSEERAVADLIAARLAE
ncbi:FMN-binding negative transcriptional regulator [soil metagenome]